jgi:hypothetical protein
MAQQGLDKALTATKKGRAARDPLTCRHMMKFPRSPTLCGDIGGGSSDDDWYRAERS